MAPPDHHLHALGLAEGDDDHDDAVVAGVASHTENGADASRAAPPIVGMIRRAAQDDRPRRSASYRHTDPYEKAVDRSTGLEYEIRACKYCDTAFSFKGGTTSAAMRHLRLTHPREFYGFGDLPPLPPAPLLPPPTQAPQATHRSQQPAVEEPYDNQQQQEEDERPPQPSSAQDHEEQPPVVEVEAVDGDEADLTEAEAHEPESRLPPAPRVIHYKRRRYDDDVHGSAPLSANQLAVAHFIAHHKLALPPTKRFAFIKHLTYNDREAAMYNVLDEEMRLEFLTQFNEQTPVAATIGGARPLL